MDYPEIKNKIEDIKKNLGNFSFLQGFTCPLYVIENFNRKFGDYFLKDVFEKISNFK